MAVKEKKAPKEKKDADTEKDGETAVAEIPYNIRVEDAGPATKKVHVKIPITDEHVDQAMQNLREQQGTLTPVEDRGVEERDQVIGDLHVKLDDKVISHQHDATINVRPGRIAGLQVDDIAEQLRGAKPGETKED